MRRIDSLARCLAVAAGLLGQPGLPNALAAPASATVRAGANLFPTVSAFSAGGDAGPVYLANSTGLYLSDLSLVHWRRTNTVSNVVAISANIDFPGDLLYATSSGLFRSLDQGTTPAPVLSMPGITMLQRAALSQSTIFAAASGAHGTGIYRSLDDGITWSGVLAVSSDSPGLSTTNALAIDRRDPGHILAAIGVYHGGYVTESRDHGASWHSLPQPPGVTLEAPEAIAIDPRDSSTMWAAWSLMGHGELFHSVDGGLTWMRIMRQFDAPISTLTYDDVTGRLFLVYADARPFIFSTVDGQDLRKPIRFLGFFMGTAPPFGTNALVLGKTHVLLSGDTGSPLRIYPILPFGIPGPAIVPATTVTAPTPIVTAFLGSDDGNLYALDARTANPVWALHTSGPVGQPVVVQGLVYTASVDGHVVAAAADSGDTIWSLALSRLALNTRIAVDHRFVCIGSRDGSVYAFDRLNGRQAWRVNAGSAVSAITVDSDTVYVATSRARMMALRIIDGTKLWDVATGDRFAGSIVVSPDRVLLGTNLGNVVAFDRPKGTTAWIFHSSFTRSMPGPAVLGAVAGNRLFVGSADHHVYGLDLRTGKPLFAYDTGAQVQSAPAFSGGYVYAGNWRGTVFALDAATGLLQWTYQRGSAIYGSPAVGDLAVLVGYADHTLVALDALHGDLKWSRPYALTNGAPVITTPADGAGPISGGRYFVETHHNMSGMFLRFWQANGGLKVFGLPLTEAYRDLPGTVQFTERFELLSSNGIVTTLPLGRTLTSNRVFTPTPAPARAPGVRYIVFQNGFVLDGDFFKFWNTGNLQSLLGTAISPLVTEENGDGTGRSYRLQWFERGRLEYHPELIGTKYYVELGLVGKQQLVAMGWL